MIPIETLLKQLFPNKVITYRLSVLNNILSNKNESNECICIGIEKDNHSRIFCYLTLNELIKLSENCSLTERSFDEVISPNMRVKVYIDFEYYIDVNTDIQNSFTGISTCLKILHLLFNSNKNPGHENRKEIATTLRNILVLEA